MKVALLLSYVIAKVTIGYTQAPLTEGRHPLRSLLMRHRQNILIDFRILCIKGHY